MARQPTAVAVKPATFDFEKLPMPVTQQAPQGRGSETVTLDDVTIPRIEIIQDLSPQRKKNDPKYIQGAEEGLVFDTVSNQLYGAKVYIVPVLWRKEYVIWRDRNKGGGFRGAFASFADAEEAVNAFEDSADLMIVDTAQNFVLVAGTDGSVEEAVISMSKGKMSASRQLNALARQAGGDRFSRVYKLETIVVNGAKGDYYSWRATQLGATPDALFKKAEEMYEAVHAGVRDVARDDAGEE